MSSLTNEDKAKVRYHLGYLASGFPASMQFGSPRPYPTVFLLEEAMNLLVEPHAVDRVRQHIKNLDCLEQQLMAATEKLTVEQVDTVKLRGNACDLIEREYNRWADRLADVFGVPRYAYSNRTTKASVGPGSVIRVVG